MEVHQLLGTPVHQVGHEPAQQEGVRGGPVEVRPRRPASRISSQVPENLFLQVAVVVSAKAVLDALELLDQGRHLAFRKETAEKGQEVPHLLAVDPQSVEGGGRRVRAQGVSPPQETLESDMDAPGGHLMNGTGPEGASPDGVLGPVQEGRPSARQALEPTTFEAGPYAELFLNPLFLEDQDQGRQILGPAGSESVSVGGQGLQKDVQVPGRARAGSHPFELGREVGLLALGEDPPELAQGRPGTTHGHPELVEILQVPVVHHPPPGGHQGPQQPPVYSGSCVGCVGAGVEDRREGGERLHRSPPGLRRKGVVGGHGRDALCYLDFRAGFVCKQ